MLQLPVIKTLSTSISCQGLTIRTTNENEAIPENAKIPQLWQEFQNQFAPKMTEDSKIYGIYHNYQSDFNGEFDVTAAIAEVNTVAHPLINISIPEGSYLVFSKQGQMPQAVIDVWSDIWKFFTESSCAYTRKYDVDFEQYVGTKEVQVYISIED